MKRQREAERLRQVVAESPDTVGEVWTAAIAASPVPERKRRLSPAEMLARYEQADSQFQRVLSTVRSRGGWDDTFVDELCQPPESFTFGGMLAHLITFNSYRRLTAAAVLRGLGVDDVGFGDPIEYEREATSRNRDCKGAVAAE